ncbi:MAG: hypothetical protein IKK55_03965 [Clostridia bacterium]|nr:hypothetical protein [Clostridia bacterium]
MGKTKKKQEQKNFKSAIAFNTNYILWLVGLGITIWGNNYLFSEENKFSWILLFLSVVFGALLILDAFFYIFTKEEIYFVHFWGYKKRLPWFYVSKIVKHNFLRFIGYRKIMGYEVFYDRPYKERVIRTSLILPLSFKIKKCLNEFWKKGIIGETERKKSRFNVKK